MNKIQPSKSSSNNQAGKKIWLGIFIAMFAIPEILWSPIANFLYIFIKNSDPAELLRFNFLTESDPDFLYKMIVFIQLVGLLGALFILIKNGKSINNKYWYYILLTLDSLLILSTVFVFYLITFLNLNLVM